MTRAVLAACAVALLSCSDSSPEAPPRAAQEVASGVSPDSIAELIAAEVWIRAHTPGLKKLGPKFLSGEWSEGSTEVRSSTPIGMGLVEEELAGGFGDAVRTLLQLDDASIKFVDAVPGATPGTWDAVLTAMVRGTDKDGSAVVLSGGMRSTWNDDGTLTALTTTKVHRIRAVRRLFSEVAPTGALAAARRSIHEEKVLELVKNGEDAVETPDHFEIAAFDRHPGLSVVDIDNDGWDDLYVMARWGANQLLRNRGDGTFEEVAAQWGLDLVDHCSSAVFADFDGDGDEDVFIGRTLERSAYLENTGARFELRDVGELPFLVSAVSAADVDNDGRLDVYFATYAVSLMQEQFASQPGVRGVEDLARVAREGHPLLAKYIGDEDAAELGRRTKAPDMQMFVNFPGPPNVLLRNTPDGFVAVDEDASRAWRSTYGMSFGDLDGDGDQDLYLANDYGPNSLLRNDGGRFVDITDTTATSDVGFGMGVSWGDYDGDGDNDLYVSNMFSKAGTRITSKLSGVDERMAKAAAGNTLLRQDEGGTLTLASGEAGDAQPVRIAGWSWGGQFGDLDNDGRLDLFVPAGYYTAPAEVASEADC